MGDRTGLARAVWLAAGTFVGFAPAWLQAQDAEPAPQRIEVIGSSIKRIQAEGPLPVETYDRKQIERTGATTVNELLKSIATIDIFDQGELASNTPSGSGTSSALLRGLDETNVLVLLNGRRLPINALYDATGAGAAFDLNVIPPSALGRVEILKQGSRSS